MDPSHNASIEASLNTPQSICVLTYTPLDVQTIIKSVADDGAGASAVFIGTTRNSFKGKRVTRLEYQAYSKIAIKSMSAIAHDAMQSVSRSEHAPQTNAPVSPAVIKCAVHHRLGNVPVGEPSIVIAVSSPHRKEAFVVSEKILEDVKEKTQIWKREYYEGEDESEAVWKANR